MDSVVAQIPLRVMTAVDLREPENELPSRVSGFKLVHHSIRQLQDTGVEACVNGGVGHGGIGIVDDGAIVGIGVCIVGGNRGSPNDSRGVLELVTSDSIWGVDNAAVVGIADGFTGGNGGLNGSQGALDLVTSDGCAGTDDGAVVVVSDGCTGGNGGLNGSQRALDLVTSDGIAGTDDGARIRIWDGVSGSGNGGTLNVIRGMVVPVSSTNDTVIL